MTDLVLGTSKSIIKEFKSTKHDTKVTQPEKEKNSWLQIYQYINPGSMLHSGLLTLFQSTIALSIHF